MTINEQQMLTAILNSDFLSDPQNPVDDEVYLWDVTERFGASASGIMASLVKKGYAGTTGVLPDDDGRCWITQAGFEALTAAR